jgi:uncharacterized membrane protein (UPF0127 family)
MEKLKFWGIAIGFILFLWLFTPDDSEPLPEEAFPEQQISQGQILEDGSLKGGIEIPDRKNELPPMQFKTAKVPITTSRGNLPLVLGFAYTPKEQRMGMMFHRNWPRTMHGLLFLFKEEDNYSMWMRNTYLSLDMLFIDRNGYITQIEKNTTPLNDTPIKAILPTLGVLEIPAGSADKWNLRVGDQLRLKYFRSALPGS